MRSIRAFLVVVILAVITLFYFVAALRGYQSSMAEVERLFDKQLMDTALLIADFQAQDTARNLGYDSSIAFQVWQDDNLIASSLNAPRDAIGDFEQGFGFSNFSGYRWRTGAYFDTRNDNWVLVADRTDLRLALAENVIRESLFPALAGLPVVGLLIWIIVTGGLRPLRALARELGGKQPEDLSPLTISAPRQELALIVASCNGLMARLESSLLREKQFASDAAHELRTPISALKLQVYNLAHEPGIDDDLVTELEQTVLRLEHIVDQILDLYRSSPDRYNANFESVDLGDLTREVLAEEYFTFDRKSQQLEFQGEACIVSGDRFGLKTLLRNLLSNARKFTPMAGQIMVTVNHQGDFARLTVEDSGPGIPQDQCESVFERFYRIGGDGHPLGEQGCGLGLAIVKRLVELHRGLIWIEPSRFSTGAAFHVDLPLCREPGARLERRKKEASDDLS